MTTWVPSEKIVEAVTAIMMRTGDTIAQAQYAELCSEATRLAQSDLIRILTLKGYSAGQIASWDDRGRYLLDQAIFWAITRLVGVAQVTDTNYSKFDRRKELELAPAILIGGVAVKPGPSEVGGITSGRMAAFDSVHLKNFRQ